MSAPFRSTVLFGSPNSRNKGHANIEGLTVRYNEPGDASQIAPFAGGSGSHLIHGSLVRPESGEFTP